MVPGQPRVSWCTAPTTVHLFGSERTLIIMEREEQSGFTPAKDSQAVDHGGVRVCPHQAVWVEQTIVVEDHPSQVLQVHLVNDP